ncbi:hypothetical protein H5410_020370 [Solanum commersonii]|uniref:Uncharacterized protein n=1 Tax=Solanum commersonii TaxID=4109 RepID=A0A9J5Z890_SOLCO|nr:hypothetical protein H5410_020370 [Solanum commersonii]
MCIFKVANSRKKGNYKAIIRDDEEEEGGINNNINVMFSGNINREEEMSVMVSALTRVITGEDRILNQENNNNIIGSSSLNKFSGGVGEKRGREEQQYFLSDIVSSSTGGEDSSINRTITSNTPTTEATFIYTTPTYDHNNNTNGFSMDKQSPASTFPTNSVENNMVFSMEKQFMTGTFPTNPVGNVPVSSIISPNTSPNTLSTISFFQNSNPIVHTQSSNSNSNINPQYFVNGDFQRGHTSLNLLNQSMFSTTFQYSSSPSSSSTSRVPVVPSMYFSGSQPTSQSSESDFRATSSDSAHHPSSSSR